MIEAAKESDIDSIVHIENQTFTSAWSKQLLLESIRQNEVWVLRNVSSAIGSNPQHQQLQQHLQQQHKPIIAFLIATVVSDEASLLQIAVDPDFHRQGFGKQLLSLWLSSLPSEVSKIWIEVRASNAGAQALYISNGFRKMSERKGYYRTSNSNQKETAYIFCLDKKLDGAKRD